MNYWNVPWGCFQRRVFPNCSIRTLDACSSTAIPYSESGIVGRGRTVSRVLYPLRDGDHLSATPVARRL